MHLSVAHYLQVSLWLQTPMVTWVLVRSLWVTFYSWTCSLNTRVMQSKLYLGQFHAAANSINHSFTWFSSLPTPSGGGSGPRVTLGVLSWLPVHPSFHVSTSVSPLSSAWLPLSILNSQFSLLLFITNQNASAWYIPITFLKTKENFSFPRRDNSTNF